MPSYTTIGKPEYTEDFLFQDGVSYTFQDGVQKTFSAISYQYTTISKPSVPSYTTITKPN